MKGSIRKRRMVWLVLAAGTLACGTPQAASAIEPAGKAPLIESMSAGVGREVSVGANINPEGLNTNYEIVLECMGIAPECASGNPRATGVLAGNGGSREVTLDVPSLQAGTYWFSVYASNAAGSVFRRSDILNVPPTPPGACPEGCPTSPGTPYEPEMPEWLSKYLAEQAARTVAEYEAKQRSAQEAAAHEREVAAAQEAARLAAEAAAREAQQEPVVTAPPMQACVVPSLRGEKLAAARKNLAKAHCRLGGVRRPAHDRSALVVASQSARRGKRLPGGAAVAVTLGAAPRRSA
ncbi:MAG TPA: hypothetical protein VL988_05580 [Solirubrobacteraceae bacterium]|nr:hypothetical protein [Solirubrobacteraceae bacterium]